MICKQVMDRVSAVHLREHGYTTQRYHRVYGASRPLPSSSRSGSLTDPTARMDMVNAVAERLVSDKVWLACISDEVGERMMNGPLRQRLSWMLTTMLANRAQVHGESLAVLNGALQELQADWRATQGGEGGGPTDTGTLLSMVEKAGKLVKESEEAVQRTIKLALEEQRAEAQWADTAGPTLYRGEHDKLAMPTGVSTGDREIMRNLVSMIGKHAARANTLSVEGTPLPHPPQGGTTPHPTSGDSQQDTCAPLSMANDEQGTLMMAHDGDQSAIDDGHSAQQNIGSLTDPVGDPLPLPPRGARPRDANGGINDSSGGPSRNGGTPRGAANPSGNLAASANPYGNPAAVSPDGPSLVLTAAQALAMVKRAAGSVTEEQWQAMATGVLRKLARDPSVSEGAREIAVRVLTARGSRLVAGAAPVVEVGATDGRCSAITARGSRCKRRATDGAPGVCGQHWDGE